MELRTFVTFEAEFPDDGKFTEILAGQYLLPTLRALSQ